MAQVHTIITSVTSCHTVQQHYSRPRPICSYLTLNYISGRRRISTRMYKSVQQDTFLHYDIPNAEDVEAFKRALTKLAPSSSSATIFIGIAKWFNKIVTQRIYRHYKESAYVGRLIGLDIVMSLMTRQYALEHCSITIYASEFPSFSTLCMTDLQYQAQDLGSLLKKMEVRVAALTIGEAEVALVKRLESCGMTVKKMEPDDWEFIFELEREWTQF